LKASNEQMIELCNKFFANDLAVCSLGVKNIFEVRKHIENLKKIEF
jgi:hypothetical protein